MTGEELKEIREKKLNMSQTELARSLGITVSHLSRLENNKTPIKDSYVDLISKIQGKNGHQLNIGHNHGIAIGNINKMGDGEMEELFILIKKFAPPQMLEEIRKKLLKIEAAIKED